MRFAFGTPLVIMGRFVPTSVGIQPRPDFDYQVVNAWFRCYEVWEDTVLHLLGVGTAKWLLRRVEAASRNAVAARLMTCRVPGFRILPPLMR